MRAIVVLTTMLCLLGFDGIAQARDGVSEAIQAVVVENLHATQAEDVDRVLKTVHTQSPSYLQTKHQLAPLFDSYELSYKLLSFSFLGMDGEYAVARVKQETKKVSGPPFQNNELDLIHVFRQEGGAWKFWSQAALEIQFTNP
jgi:hypothetical protein